MLTGFDYLHDARPVWLMRLYAMRVPAYLHNAASALFCAIVIVLGAWGIEVNRLHVALTTQQLFEVRFEASRTEMERTNVLYDRLKRLAGVDRQVHDIERSGDLDARRLAEIADRLPTHAWLTSIARDDSGLTLEGRARDLAVIGRTVRALATGRFIGNPVLLSATADSDAGGHPLMRYQLHVDGERL
ncbi:MAG: PilN domain-containing protein [Candidatus Eremiobacteraeota bacterium]|nr:PilN domain-containing protein [Candidatus Eremiobacteraeota bacterium]